MVNVEWGFSHVCVITTWAVCVVAVIGGLDSNCPVSWSPCRKATPGKTGVVVSKSIVSSFQSADQKLFNFCDINIIGGALYVKESVCVGVCL